MKVLAIILSATCLLQQLECFYIDDMFDGFFDDENKCNPLFDLSAGLPTYDEINEKLSCLASTNTDKMKLDSIGRSINGRKIPHVVLSTGDSPNKPIILVDSLLHGDETDVLFAMNNLIDNLLKPEYSTLLYNMEWHLLPIINPDGFVAGTRKNLANEGSECVGVDLNRNFADALNASSQDMCSRDYSVKALSEPETVALRNFFLEKGSQIEYYLALHGCHENRIIPVLAKDGEGATVESIKEMFVKARELKVIGDYEGVGYAIRSPIALDETDFPKESKYEVQEAPNGNALTYAVDVAGVSKAFVIGHGPNQDKQRIVDGIWSIVQNVAQTTIEKYELNPFLNDPLVNYAQSIWNSVVNFDYLGVAKNTTAEIYADILKRKEADEVSKLWPQMQNLAKGLESITTESIYEAYSKMNEARKQMTADTLNQFNEILSKFELTDPQIVYDYFSTVGSWTTEKASAVRSAMLDLSSKIKAMSSQDFVAHIDSMKSEVIAEALRLVGEMQELTSTIKFEIPESLETSMKNIDSYTKELAEKSWAHIQEVKSRFETLDLDTLTSGISSLRGLAKVEVSNVVAQLNDALNKLNVSIPEIYIPSFTMSSQTSEKVNEILSKLKNVATELGKLTPDSFIGNFSAMTFQTKKYVMNAFNKMETLISEIEYPVPQVVLDKYNEGKTLAEQQVSEFRTIMDSFTSKMTVFGMNTDYLYKYISNGRKWSYDKITESLTTLKDLAKKFEVPSANDVVTAVDDWTKAKASEMSNLIDNLTRNIRVRSFNPQSLYDSLPALGDVSMTKEEVLEAVQKLMQMFD